MANIAVVHHTIQGVEICQRERDGYFNATSMCHTLNKQWHDFHRLNSTKAFIEALSNETGIPVLFLVETTNTGIKNQHGTWIHPHLAIYLAQWLSPQFAVKVSQWVFMWTSVGERQKFDELQQNTSRSLKLNDIFEAVNPLQKTLIEITHTQQGELIHVNKLEQQTDVAIDSQKSTTENKPLWIIMVETFFTEIENEGIPEKMRQNMLIANETVMSARGKRERHPCLFFRASNLMALFREKPHFFALLDAASIHTASALLATLNKAGILAFHGKTKEKGIPINPNLPSKTRRVPHLVAIDLVVLEQDYGRVMLSHGQIATR